MEPTIGDVVLVLRGRDAGRPMVVVGQDGDRLLLADGVHRLLARPKSKNARHVRHLESAGLWFERLKNGQWSDADMRQVLREFETHAKGGKEDAER